MANMQRYVDLNVGGSNYTTSLETLTRYPESMLATMFSQENIPLGKDQSGRYIIDRDGPAFRSVLNFLHGGNLNLPNGFTYDQLMEEVDFYRLDDMKELLELRVKMTQDNSSFASWSFPSMAKTTIRVNNDQVFAMSVDVNPSYQPTQKIRSIAHSFGTSRRMQITRVGQQSREDYVLECDPTTFHQLLNFHGRRPNADYMRRSQEELRRLREAAEMYHINELKLVLRRNIHMMPNSVDLRT